ncbi:(d)CMP kinase [Mycoplasma sp. Mirounga ES2805-ORL]|uniref:(d)CMP kinase n=1 Tax=Mycoplasma sp. Mirounga ES2805-ORL TaxID=754514 RepID=UPI00197BD4E1|nr:(d)CMP kinase [Mycoplasma sp. Mirounga ES2805-ORL]QSF13428.1 (d)CMP kinase [Mycoplasma sp. Mirounga ES2805-ORL]
MSEKTKINIAIDGPSGAGKSSVSQKIAKKLGYISINTGSIYRVIAMNAINNKANLNNEKEVIDLLKNVVIEPEKNDVIYFDGVNVSTLIRTKEISQGASAVAKHKLVREYVVNICQNLAKNKKGYVMDGRDTTFKILPFAEVKIFLTASPEARAKRRQQQNEELGEKDTYDKVLKDIKDRDFQDMNRKVDPLHKTEDAIEIDCTNLTIDDVVNKIIALAKKVINE